MKKEIKEVRSLKGHDIHEMTDDLFEEIITEQLNELVWKIFLEKV